VAIGILTSPILAALGAFAALVTECTIGAEKMGNYIRKICSVIGIPDKGHIYSNPTTHTEGSPVKHLAKATYPARGSYILLIEMPVGKAITIGRLKDTYFKGGYYAYVGSALGGIKARLNHHLKRKKKRHWHIDYLLQEASIIGISVCRNEQRVECILAETLGSQFNTIAGFGSSDCHCQSHLFFSAEKLPIKASIEATVKSLAVD